MELILTSFGLSHIRKSEDDNPDLFYRMPPISLSQLNSFFSPDYAVLLLCERVTIDSNTYHRVMEDNKRGHYKKVGETFKMLHEEGFVRIEDFDKVVEENTPLLKDMLDSDLKEMDLWVQALKESVTSWQEFFSTVESPISKGILWSRESDKNLTEKELQKYQEIRVHTARWLHFSCSAQAHYLVERAMYSSRDRRKKKFRNALRKELSKYLAYVNANLLLSQFYETGFHDWCDFHPFYRAKFRRMGQENVPFSSEIENIQNLFEISFPELTFWEPDLLVKALKDKRIRDLRQLVNSAVIGDVRFDREFATRVLGEVIKIERQVGRRRKIVSYITVPLGVIPWVGTVIQKGVEESVDVLTTRKQRKNFRWFYMISDLAEEYQRRQSQ